MVWLFEGLKQVHKNKGILGWQFVWKLGRTHQNIRETLCDMPPRFRYGKQPFPQTVLSLSPRFDCLYLPLRTCWGTLNSLPLKWETFAVGLAGKHLHKSAAFISCYASHSQPSFFRFMDLFYLQHNLKWSKIPNTAVKKVSLQPTEAIILRQ